MPPWTRGLRLLHFLVGGACLLTFFYTGFSMKESFPAVYQGEGRGHIRFVMRANHIYILLSALTNLALAPHVSTSWRAWRRWLQFIASGLLMLTPPLFIATFFTEAQDPTVVRPVTTLTALLPLAGVGLHLIAGFRDGQAKGGGAGQGVGGDTPA